MIKKIFTPSKTVNLLILMAVLWCDFNTKRWNNESCVINWDIISYYAYLPATFIYHDITLNFIDKYHGQHKFVFWPERAPNGGRCIKTTMGLSVLYSPFFFMGHLAAKLMHYDTGGYSAPYKFFLTLSTVFYLMLGLYFLRKILENYFSSWITALTLFATVVTTNLFYYSTIECTMSHAYSFSLFILFIYLTIKWHKKQTIVISAAIGLLAGIISLIRPSNIIVALIFLLYNISTWSDVKERIKFFLTNYGKILIILICILLVWLPQLLYWKKITGQWLFNSYTGERFFFSNPQIIKGLFGFRKGWLIYTPIMLFAIAGIPILFKQLKAFAWPILIFLTVNIYIILSWWAWWYGGGFGLRPFVDSYGLMAIPLAMFLTWAIKQRNTFLRYIMLVLFVLVSLKSIHYTFQYYYGAIHSDSMTRKAYFQSFWHIRPTGSFWSLLKEPDYEKAREGIQATKPVK